MVSFTSNVDWLSSRAKTNRNLKKKTSNICDISDSVSYPVYELFYCPPGSGWRSVMMTGGSRRPDTESCSRLSAWRNQHFSQFTTFCIKKQNPTQILLTVIYKQNRKVLRWLLFVHKPKQFERNHRQNRSTPLLNNHGTFWDLHNSFLDTGLQDKRANPKSLQTYPLNYPAITLNGNTNHIANVSTTEMCGDPESISEIARWQAPTKFLLQTVYPKCISYTDISDSVALHPETADRPVAHSSCLFHVGES